MNAQVPRAQSISTLTLKLSRRLYPELSKYKFQRVLRQQLTMLGLRNLLWSGLFLCPPVTSWVMLPSRKQSITTTIRINDASISQSFLTATPVKLSGNLHGENACFLPLNQFSPSTTRSCVIGKTWLSDL